MKKYIFIAAIVLVFVGLLADFNPALAQQGRRGFRGQSADILCDALVLNAAKAEKVTAAYQEVSTKVFENMRNENVDWQNMSQEERQERFEKIQKDTAAGLQKELKDILSEKELKAIELVLARRVRTPVAELRGLRMIELKDEQCAKLQPLAVQLTQAIVTLSPRNAEADEIEKANKKFAEEKALFMKKAAELLNVKQNEAWKSETEKAQKEIDEMLAQRRNRQR